ncbi:NAD(P)-binding protein [Xylaria curta]|nr:NAD(P)-binding protein [Xylaria curta]
MSSYVVTGASRGIGYGFILELSKNPANTVIGIVRDVKYTEEKLAKEPEQRGNIHLLQGDMIDYQSLKNAAEKTSEITGGSLDYLIGNAGVTDPVEVVDAFDTLANDPLQLESALLFPFNVNVIGNVHLINLFMPLILKGRAKKVIAISSSSGDAEFVTKVQLDWGPGYAISKAALNMAVAKFSARYAGDGVLVMAICPGMVATEAFRGLTDEQRAKLPLMVEKFKHVYGDQVTTVTTETSVKNVLSVIERSSVLNRDGGSFVSHKGNKEWL